MLYILAAWTGYRRKELASLTLNDDPIPTVRVHAGASKRKKNEAIPLHDYVVLLFRKRVS